MRYAYPMEIEQDVDGRFLVTFPDVPQAHDDGITPVEAIEGATGALVAALQGYVKARMPIPVPSAAAGGQRTIAVPPLAAAKLALYQEMCRLGLTNSAMARLLGGVSETEVRRLIDLEYRSRIAQVEAALAVLGKELVTEARDKAA